MNSVVKRSLREVRLMYVVRDVYRQLKTRQDASGSVSGVSLLPDSYRYVVQFKETAREHDLSYSIVLLPLFEEDFLEMLTGRLTEDGISFVDLAPVRDEFTLEEFQVSKFDAHPSAAVHRRIGEVLAEYVLQEQLGSD